MKVSVNAIKYLNQHYGSAGNPAPKGVGDLAARIGAQLGAIDEVIDFGSRFNDVLVAKVVSCQPHPNADKLKICLIDDGRKAKDMSRDEHGLVQVVCGAPNVKPDILVAWLRPGVAVPETIDKEPLVLDAREIRGVVSNGMLASAKELGLSDDHSGILRIDWPAKPGDLFGDIYHLTGDKVLDIENKMFTHRPDCFGWLGIAREIEGIHGRPYKSPKWYTVNPKFAGIEAEPLKLEVQNDIPALVPRFTAITLRSVQVGPSPVWLQADLARVGVRSINNIVDYTNWYMVLTGQPLHAYDYDKVMAQDVGAKHATLVVRHPKKDETITLLNGKTIKPHPGAIMIATKDRLIGLGGMMGGADTEVDETTSNIIIESATFDMYTIRRTAMEHGIFTDAVTRFTKGQSPLQNLAALAKITSQICENAHGKVAGPVIDDNHLPKAVRERRNLHPPVRITAEFINARLGVGLKKQEIAKLLKNVEFDVAITGHDISVTAPFWRTDIELPEDVVEEVGRLYGYNKLPLILPRRDITPAIKNPVIDLRHTLQAALSQAGANEVLTYSFVHGNLLTNVGQDAAHAFRLSNAISPDLQYYRLSLTPSLLEKVHPNIKAGHGQFALFEVNKIHCKGVSNAIEPEVPQEDTHLALVFAANDKTAAAHYQGAPFYQAKHYLSRIMPGAETLMQPLADFNFATDTWGKQMCAPYEPKRAAVLVKDGLAWGVVGELRATVKKALKLPDYTAGFEVALDLLQDKSATYKPLSRFPKVEQDLCLRVPVDVTYGALHHFIQQQLTPLKPDHTDFTLSPVDAYQRPGDIAHKQITLRISLVSHQRTLTDDEVAHIVAQIADRAATALQATKI